MIEKRGVVAGEGEEPKAAGLTKEAIEEALASEQVKPFQVIPPKSAQHQSAGEDPLSKLSDTASKQPKKG